MSDQSAVAELAYTGDIVSDTAWYLAKARGQKAGPLVIGLCREMAIRQSTLRSNTEKCIAVFQYGGEARNVAPGDHFPLEEDFNTFNAAQNTVETVYAKVVKPTITPMPLTNGGGYLARHRAKQMQKAIEGVLDENNADEIEEDMVMDALTTDHGAGAIKVIECDDHVELEHVPIEDIWFDEAEIRRRKPRSCYHVPNDGMDKYVAIETFAGDDDDYPGLVGTAEERRAAILAASQKPASWRSLSSPEARHRVDIFEAWHLPSGRPEEYEEEEEDEEGNKRTVTKMRHDGRHVVAVDGPNGTLIDEPWDEDHFPILLYVPRPRRRSIWGLSLMRDLIAPQREYEKLTKKIQHQHQKMGVSGWSASKQAELDVREITAGTFGAAFVVETEGTLPPTPIVVDPVAQSTYAYADSIPRNMLERKGVSSLAAASQIPAGLQQASGKALQVFEDFEDVRLLPYHRARERLKVKLSWVIVHAAKRIVDRKGSYKVRYTDKRNTEDIDWKEVLMDKKEFIIKVFPISALSKQPSARFAQLIEMLERQAINVEQFKRLYGLPDLEAENELDTACTDLIDMNLDTMVVKGRYVAPQPFDLKYYDLIVDRVNKFYNLCRIHEVPEARLKLLRDYLEDFQSLKKQADAAAAPPAPPGGPVSGGMSPGPEGMPPEGMPMPGGMPVPAMPAAA